MGPKYNPVVRNGLFQVSLGGVVRRYRAVDETEAKYKLARFIGINGNQFYPTEMDVVVIEPTICESD